MALLTKSFILSKAENTLKRDYRYYKFNDSILVKSLLNESIKFQSSYRKYDIFLSHSYLDNKEILGLKIFFEELGYSTYIDWIDDKQLNRSNVNKNTASTLRSRMINCKCLFFSTSKNSENSKWMPWELGYMDALKNKVAICPLVDISYSDSYKGQEYLGLYPFVSYTKADGSHNKKLWINDPDDSNVYIDFKTWINGGRLYYHETNSELIAR